MKLRDLFVIRLPNGLYAAPDGWTDDPSMAILYKSRENAEQELADGEDVFCAADLIPKAPRGNDR